MFSLEQTVEFIHYSGRTIQGRVTEIQEVPKNQLYMGRHSKSFGEFEFAKGTKSKGLRLLCKTAYIGADNYLSNYMILKESGLPVPPTTRKIDENFVAVTDYTRSGAVFFGKGMKVAMEYYGISSVARNYIDNIPGYAWQGFADAYTHFGGIDKKLYFYEQIANEKKILLPIDDEYETVVFPDHNWRLLLLDLHTVNLNRPNAERLNAYCRTRTLQGIVYMFDWLLINKPDALPENLQSRKLLQVVNRKLAAL